MTSNRLEVTDEPPYDRVEPVVREGVVVLGMAGFIILGTALPGNGHEIAGTDVLVRDLILAIGTLGIVATLLYAAPKLHRLVAASLEGPLRTVEDVAGIARGVLVFGAVVIAHLGLSPVVSSVIDRVWVYDLAFLLFALLPLGVIAYRFHRTLDPLTEFITATLLGGERRTEIPVRREDDR